MSTDDDGDPPDLLVQRLGPVRGAEVRAQLAEHDLVAVDRTDLARLREVGAAYARLEALVEEPEA